MIEWYEALTGLQKLFVIIGGVGTLIFLIQFVLMLVGGDGDADASGAEVDMATDMSDGDFDFTGTDLDDVHVDSDVGFQLLSIQGLSVFFMMFGLVGLAFSRGGGYGAAISLLAGFVVGLIFMYIVAKMFAFFKTLQNSGTISLKNAIGQEGRVYLSIKSDEPGQIEVVVQGHLSIYSARSKHNEEIPTDSRVRVVDVLNDEMIVEKVTTD